MKSTDRTYLQVDLIDQTHYQIPTLEEGLFYLRLPYFVKGEKDENAVRNSKRKPTITWAKFASISFIRSIQSFHEWRMVATVPSNKDSINFLASIHIQFVVVVVASASAFVVAVVVTIVQV